MFPKRGEIWLVNFEPQVGQEIKKQRPALVMSAEVLERLPVATVLPIREYKEHHGGKFYFVPVDHAKENGLIKKSTVDCVQLKSFAKERFIKKIGVIDKENMKLIKMAVRLCLDV